MRVGVIFGGNSVEHDISIISAVQVMNQLREFYEVIPIYISKDNKLFTSKKFFDIDTFRTKFKVRKVRFVEGGIKGFTQKSLDFVFPLVHGKNVEDGSIKAILDFYHIPNSASDLIPSAINQDKVFMKDILRFNNIPVVDYCWFFDYNWYEDYQKVIEKIEKIQYPIIVKPSTLGSSIGISVCENKEQLIDGVMLALKYDNKILVEKFIEKTEYNISLIGSGNDVITSQVEEVTSDDVYTFEKKYENKFKRNKMIQNNEVADLAVKCFKLLGLSGVIRIDVFKSELGIFINEINTIPGSLSRYLWDLMDKEFFDKLIKIGLEEDRFIKSFSSSVLQHQVNKMSKLL